MKDSIRIRQATKAGYIEVPRGGVIDWSYPESTTRRGRYQNGLCPSLTAGQAEIYYYEGVEEMFEQDD